MFNQKKVARLEKLVSEFKQERNHYRRDNEDLKLNLNDVIIENDSLRQFIKKIGVFRNTKGQMQSLKVNDKR